MVNWTSIKMSDLNKHRYTRMDAKFWIQKALLKKKKKIKKSQQQASNKLDSSSGR